MAKEELKHEAVKETEDASLVRPGRMSKVAMLFRLFGLPLVVVTGLICWVYAKWWFDILVIVSGLGVCSVSVRHLVMAGFVTAQAKMVLSEPEDKEYRRLFMREVWLSATESVFDFALVLAVGVMLCGLVCHR